MLEMIERLLTLQEKDQRLRGYQNELTAIPTEIQVKERLIAEAAARLDKAKTRQKEIEVEKRTLEVEAAAKREQIARYKTQQMQTRKNEEFTALAHEIETAERAITAIEDKEIELMEEAESLKPQIAEAEAAYDTDKKKFESQIATLRGKTGNLEGLISELTTERAAAAAGIDEDLIEQYGRLFRNKGGQAVVALENDICTGCHMKVTTQTVVEVKAAKSIVSCPQCGRLLHPAA